MYFHPHIFSHVSNNNFQFLSTTKHLDFSSDNVNSIELMTHVIDAATQAMYMGMEYPELMCMLLVLMETHALTYMGGLQVQTMQ